MHLRAFIRRYRSALFTLLTASLIAESALAVVITHNNSTLLFGDTFENTPSGSGWDNGMLPGSWTAEIPNTVTTAGAPGPFEGTNFGLINRTSSEQGIRAQFNSVNTGRVDLDTMINIPNGQQWLSIALGNDLGINPAAPASNTHSYVTFHLNSTHEVEDGAIDGFPKMGFQYRNNEWMRLQITHDFDNVANGYSVNLTTSDGTFNYTRGAINADVPINSLLIKFEANDNSAYFDGVQAISPIPHASRSIDLSQHGKPLNHKVFGQAVPTSGGSESFEQDMNDSTVAITGGASIRGVAGGLAADTYNWKDQSGRVVGEFGIPGRPTLEYLRYAREQEAELFITVNARGTGTGVSSLDFEWQDTSLAPLTTLAANWVRYANKIAPQYRQGDTLSPSDAAIVNSLSWGEYDRLLPAQEENVSPVKYWEIGNEPDVGISDSQGTVMVLTPSQYADRYVAITSAMLAQDPTIKVGPVVKRGINDAGNAPDPWLLAVLALPDAQVDFISYHPYENIFHPYLSNGTLPTPQSLEEQLRGIKAKQNSEYQLVRSAIQNNNSNPARPQRSLDTPAVASEWNVSSASSNGTFVARSTGHALGVAETLFTFAEIDNLLAAHYWVWPVKYWEGLPTPTYRLYEALEEHGGDVLLESYSDNEDFRLYTTTDAAQQNIALWGLNFSDSTDKLMQLSLANPEWNLENATITLMQLTRVDGTDVSLLDSTSTEASDPLSIDWVTTDLTGQIDLSNFQLTFEDATITVLIISSPPQMTGDYNNDGIVNAADYTVWRDSLGQQGLGLAADGNQDGKVDVADYTFWKERYGTLVNTGAGVGLASSIDGSRGIPVPEPNALWHLLVSLSVLFSRCRWIQYSMQVAGGSHPAELKVAMRR